MARRRGGFGGQGSFANAGAGGGGGGGGGNAFNRGPSAAPTPAPMRAGGGNNRNRNNPFNNRQQRRRQQQRRQGGGGGTDAPADDGSGDSTDSQTAADAFQNQDYRTGATWAYLGGAGIRNDNPMGGNATNWLTNRVDSLATDYQGQHLLNPDLTYNDYLNQRLAGQQAAAPVAATPAPVNDPNTEFHTMGRNRRRRLRMLPHRGGPEPAPVPAPSAGTPVGVPTDPAAVRALLMRDYESSSPLSRGYDSRSARAPRRVVQF